MLDKNLQEILSQNPEWEKIIETSEKEVNEMELEMIFLNVISQLRETFRKLNDDDSYKLSLKLKA